MNCLPSASDGSPMIVAYSFRASASFVITVPFCASVASSSLNVTLLSENVADPVLILMPCLDASSLNAWSISSRNDLQCSLVKRVIFIYDSFLVTLHEEHVRILVDLTFFIFDNDMVLTVPEYYSDQFEHLVLLETCEPITLRSHILLRLHGSPLCSLNGLLVTLGLLGGSDLHPHLLTIDHNLLSTYEPIDG